MIEEQKWVNGGIYRDSKDLLLYHANKGSLGWAFYRLHMVDGLPAPIIIAGSAVGYQQVPSGYWHVLRLGDPKYTDARYIMSPYTDFDIDILPNLQLVADSIETFIKGM